MNNSRPLEQKDVILASRKQNIITCPHCWTDQRTDRSFCYQCGAEFIYLDEANSVIEQHKII